MVSLLQSRRPAATAAIVQDDSSAPPSARSCITQPRDTGSPRAGERAPRVEYRLTEKGRGLGQAVDALARWGLARFPGTVWMVSPNVTAVEVRQVHDPIGLERSPSISR
ncbi:MAG TPA: winged helix-turn-helix transcriptional regulator [Candidatus Eisenbacteria bacterium]|nr:winged helix-turn-helix transcriptional regulator [Candidatus Eisenbacteria bacterium]